MKDDTDNLFSKDPYYQQGGDMVRVGGMVFDCNPEAAAYGQRISRTRLVNGELRAENNYYPVSGWASVGEKSSGKPVWDVVAEYLLAGRSR